MGLALWFSSSVGEDLFWHGAMNMDIEAHHGLALLGAWRAVKYLPDVLDALLGDKT